MDDYTEEVYFKPNDIVWVKLEPFWWPGEVIDKTKVPEEVTESLKKEPIAIVKFFDDEKYFECVKSGDCIYPYICERKNDFIKKGMEAFRAKNPKLTSFPKDVTIAEVKTGGNPNILSDPMFTPVQRKRIIEMESFGTPSPKKSKSNKKNSPSKNAPVITHRRFLGYNDYTVKILIQGEGERSPDAVEILPELPEEEAKLTCPICSFVTMSFGNLLAHIGCHEDGVTQIAAPLKKPQKRKRRKPLKDSEQGEAKKSHAKKNAMDKNESETKEENETLKCSLEYKSNQMKSKEEGDMCHEIIADWDDSDHSDNESDHTSDFNSTLDIKQEFTEKTLVEVSVPTYSIQDSLCANVTEEKLTDRKQEQEKAAQSGIFDKIVDKQEDSNKEKESNISCFDFYEEEEETKIPDATMGRKIPRVIPLSEKHKSFSFEDDLLHDEKTQMKILKESEELSKSLDDVEKDEESEELDETFKSLMDSTSKFNLPDVSNILKSHQNFHYAKTVKYPDKAQETSDATVSVDVERHLIEVEECNDKVCLDQIAVSHSNDEKEKVQHGTHFDHRDGVPTTCIKQSGMEMSDRSDKFHFRKKDECRKKILSKQPCDMNKYENLVSSDTIDSSVSRKTAISEVLCVENEELTVPKHKQMKEVGQVESESLNTDNIPEEDIIIPSNDNSILQSTLQICSENTNVEEYTLQGSVKSDEKTIFSPESSSKQNKSISQEVSEESLSASKTMERKNEETTEENVESLDKDNSCFISKRKKSHRKNEKSDECAVNKNLLRSFVEEESLQECEKEMKTLKSLRRGRSRDVGRENLEAISTKSHIKLNTEEENQPQVKKQRKPEEKEEETMESTKYEPHKEETNSQIGGHKKTEKHSGDISLHLNDISKSDEHTIINLKPSEIYSQLENKEPIVSVRDQGKQLVFRGSNEISTPISEKFDWDEPLLDFQEKTKDRRSRTKRNSSSAESSKEVHSLSFQLPVSLENNDNSEVLTIEQTAHDNTSASSINNSESIYHKETSCVLISETTLLKSSSSDGTDLKSNIDFMFDKTKTRRWNRSTEKETQEPISRSRGIGNKNCKNFRNVHEKDGGENISSSHSSKSRKLSSKDDVKITPSYKEKHTNRRDIRSRDTKIKCDNDLFKIEPKERTNTSIDTQQSISECRLHRSSVKDKSIDHKDKHDKSNVVISSQEISNLHERGKSLISKEKKGETQQVLNESILEVTSQCGTRRESRWSRRNQRTSSSEKVLDDKVENNSKEPANSGKSSIVSNTRRSSHSFKIGDNKLTYPKMICSMSSFESDTKNEKKVVPPSVQKMEQLLPSKPSTKGPSEHSTSSITKQERIHKRQSRWDQRECTQGNNNDQQQKHLENEVLNNTIKTDKDIPEKSEIFCASFDESGRGQPSVLDLKKAEQIEAIFGSSPLPKPLEDHVFDDAGKKETIACSNSGTLQHGQCGNSEDHSSLNNELIIDSTIYNENSMELTNRIEPFSKLIDSVESEVARITHYEESNSEKILKETDTEFIFNSPQKAEIEPATSIFDTPERKITLKTNDCTPESVKKTEPQLLSLPSSKIEVDMSVPKSRKDYLLIEKSTTEICKDTSSFALDTSSSSKQRQVNEIATKLTNPKKRFVKSFEDFELNKQKERSAESLTPIQENQKPETSTSGIVGKSPIVFKLKKQFLSKISNIFDEENEEDLKRSLRPKLSTGNPIDTPRVSKGKIAVKPLKSSIFERENRGESKLSTKDDVSTATFLDISKNVESDIEMKTVKDVLDDDKEAIDTKISAFFPIKPLKTELRTSQSKDFDEGSMKDSNSIPPIVPVEVTKAELESLKCKDEESEDVETKTYEVGTSLAINEIEMKSNNLCPIEMKSTEVEKSISSKEGCDSKNFKVSLDRSLIDDHIGLKQQIEEKRRENTEFPEPTKKCQNMEYKELNEMKKVSSSSNEVHFVADDVTSPVEFDIKTNLSNIDKPEEFRGLSSFVNLPGLATKVAEKENQKFLIDDSKTEIITKSFPLDNKIEESEFVPIDGNLTVVSEKELAEGQVEITANMSGKKSASFLNFSMDFSDDSSDASFEVFKKEKIFGITESLDVSKHSEDEYNEKKQINALTASEASVTQEPCEISASKIDGKIENKVTIVHSDDALENPAKPEPDNIFNTIKFPSPPKASHELESFNKFLKKEPTMRKTELFSDFMKTKDVKISTSSKKNVKTTKGPEEIGHNEPLVFYNTAKSSTVTDMCDLEDHIPSQIVCAKNAVINEEVMKVAGISKELAIEKSISTADTSMSKLLHRLAGEGFKEQSPKLGDGDNDKRESDKIKPDMNSTKVSIKSSIKNKNVSSKTLVTVNSKVGNKAIILSEKIIRPARDSTSSLPMKRGHEDIEDLKPRVIPKNQKLDMKSEKPGPIAAKILQSSTKATNNSVSKQVILTPKAGTPKNTMAIKAPLMSKPTLISKIAITSKSALVQKSTGKAKILNQTIIRPAGELYLTKEKSVVEDNTEFDINSMPIVLSDDLITSDSLDNMPIVLGENIQKISGPENVKMLMDKKTPQNMKVLNKIITKQSPALKKTPMPKILQTPGQSQKLKFSSSAITPTSKGGKFLIIPEQSNKIAQSSKKPNIVKRSIPVTGTATAQSIPSETTGHKIMIVTNQQGQQQRLLLTPAQQKLFGMQLPKAKTIAKSPATLKIPVSSINPQSSIATSLVSNSKTQIGPVTTKFVRTQSTTNQTLPSQVQVVPPKRTQKIALSNQQLNKVSQQKTIVYKNQHGQTVRKIHSLDNALLDKQVAEQLEAIKANSLKAQQKQQEVCTKVGIVSKVLSKKSYQKRQDIKQTLVSQVKLSSSSVPTISGLSKDVDSSVSPIMPLKLQTKLQDSEGPSQDVKSAEKKSSDRPLNQLIIQDNMGNQTTVTEGQILALPSETVDGQPQSYMLVTLDESGNLTPLNNEALMSLDPSLVGLTGNDPNNMVLQIAANKDSTATNLNLPTTPAATQIQAKPAQSIPEVVTQISAREDLPTKPTNQVLQAPVGPTTAQVQVSCNINGETGQQIILTGDPVATQKFLNSLSEGNTELANILANAESSSFLIQTDGQQILLNAEPSESQLLQGHTTVTDQQEEGNPMFSTHPVKNQDILAAALAGTDVFQQDQINSHNKVIHSQLSPGQNMYPMNVGNVLETSLTLNSPIMTPLEVPSTNSKKIPDEEADILTTQVPKNVDLPITITDPNISQTVSHQQMLLGGDIQTNLELGLPISETAISVTSEITSSSFVYSLPNLDVSEHSEISQKSFSSSMPLLTEDIEEAPTASNIIEPKEKEQDSIASDKIVDSNKIVEKSSDIEKLKSDDNFEITKESTITGSDGSFMDEGLSTLGGQMCSSLSEPPPEMFDIPISSGGPHFLNRVRIGCEEKLSLPPSFERALLADENSMEIPVQPQIVADLKDSPTSD